MNQMTATSATTSSPLIIQRASVRPTSCHIRPKPTEDTKRVSATTVWAAAMPLARLSSGTVWVASAESTPSVAA